MVQEDREKRLDACFAPPPSSVGSAVEPCHDHDRDGDDFDLVERLHRHSGNHIYENLVDVGADHSQATADP